MTTKKQPWTYSANKAIRSALNILRVLEPIRLSHWSDEYFYMSPESSYTEGRWVCYPYQRGILDAFGNDDIEFIAVKKSARTGYTKMLMSASCYFTVFRKRNQAIWQPTDSDAQEFVETEYNSMLRDVSLIRAVFPALEKKHAHNKNDYKKFLGCLTHIKGGTSGKNYRRISIDVGIIDELSAFDDDINNEGSALKLVAKRLEGATFPKLIVGSTPKSKYSCQITKAVDDADVVYKYYVPCIHCGVLQILEFGGKAIQHGLKWIDNKSDTAAYCCKHCSALFTQADYLKVWDKGRWQDDAGNWYCDDEGMFKDAQGEIIVAPKRIGFDRLWTIYSPQATWSAIVDEFISANKKAKYGEKSDLKTFINTTLGEVYEEEVEKTEATDLKKRAEDFQLRVVPVGGLTLKAGIDIQKDRFEMVVWAFGFGEEMWTVDYRVVQANPTIQSDFSKLDELLLFPYPHVAGTVLHIEHVAIDTGNWTQQAYNYVRERRQAQNWMGLKPRQLPPKLYATKGSSIHGKSISGKPSFQDINQFDRIIKRGLKLYTIGTEVAKDLFHNRLQLTQHGPGFVHLSKHLPEEFFQHITNEVRAVKHTRKGKVNSWEPRRSGAKNECLDCTVMTLFCAHKTGLHNKTQAFWKLLESVVQPNQADLFSTGHEEINPENIPSKSIPMPVDAKLQPTFFIPD